MRHSIPPADSPPAGIDPAGAPFNAPSTALVPIRHDGWTRPRQAAFLRVLASTGNVSVAAREAGMTRQSAYKLRARLKGEPFDHAWQAAFACNYDRLAEAALERALHGVEVPHFHKGELIGTHRRFDERLTLGLLAMRAGAPAHRRPLLRNALRYVGDLEAMIERVADGPETWAEELEQIEAAEAEMDGDDEDGDWEDDWDEDEDEEDDEDDDDDEGYDDEEDHGDAEDDEEGAECGTAASGKNSLPGVNRPPGPKNRFEPRVSGL